MGLATIGSDETLRWLRAAEIKHSRVAMLATTGYLVQASGFHFPGMLSNTGISFESLSAVKPFEAWALVPDGGKAQILFFAQRENAVVSCSDGTTVDDIITGVV